MLHQCSEACGWMAGILAALSFGSFGVPIKFTSHITVDPLVMQTYKSVVCFVTCWLVLFMGESLKFTPWGIVSGIFWVPGATAGIYGIRNAGLAISVGIWSSIIVISSFAWGILIFHERVKTIGGALFASFVLILGLVGMAVYSAPTTGKKKKQHKDKTLLVVRDGKSKSSTISPVNSSKKEYDEDILRSSSTHSSMGSELELPLLDKDTLTVDTISIMDVETAARTKLDVEGVQRRKKRDEGGNEKDHTTIEDGGTNVHVSPSNDQRANVENDDVDDTAFLGEAPMKEKKDDDEIDDQDNTIKKDNEVILFGRAYTKRQLGIAGAIINGAWGSNNMVPMHYAKADGFYGAGYLISYSSGSMIITVAMWFIRYLINVYKYGGCHVKAYHALPSFHLRQMWKAGLMSGLLYSLGNFCTIISVSILGQGVGYSFVQTAMLVSGIWGIFFFHEVKGAQRIMKWLLSSVITVIGILLLSYEHVGAEVPSVEVDQVKGAETIVASDKEEATRLLF